MSTRLLLALIIAALCAACGAQPAPTPGTPRPPSPTIAAVVIPPTPLRSPTPARRPTLAPATPTAPRATPAPEPTIYLWPSYLPAGMQPAPQESRVSREGELGVGELGFYIITLNSGAQKLTIGGGGLSAALPLAGSERSLTIGGRTGTLITNGEQREIIFDQARGLLFVYSFGLSEEELLRVAESLQPIDVGRLRELAGG